MSICTWTFLWAKKENPFCTTVRSTGNETRRTFGVDRCQLCKQSMYEAEIINQSCLRERKRNDLPLRRKKKWQNGHHLVMETSAQQSRVSHHEADIFVQAWWNSFCRNFCRHARASVTQIFYITDCVIFRYWTLLSGPSRTQLITCCLIFTKSLKSNLFLYTYDSSNILMH